MFAQFSMFVVFLKNIPNLYWFHKCYYYIGYTLYCIIKTREKCHWHFFNKCGAGLFITGFALKKTLCQALRSYWKYNWQYRVLFYFEGNLNTLIYCRYMKIYGYKFSKEDHIALIHLYYELLTIPNLEPTRVNKYSCTLNFLLK